MLMVCVVLVLVIRVMGSASLFLLAKLVPSSCLSDPFGVQLGAGSQLELLVCGIARVLVKGCMPPQETFQQFLASASSD